MSHCKACRFFSSAFSPDGIEGQCRRNPPPWFYIDRDDWCGKFVSVDAAPQGRLAKAQAVLLLHEFCDGYASRCRSCGRSGIHAETCEWQAATR